MDMFVMVRRKKTSILLDAKENTTVYELKNIIQAITKVLPENQQLYKDDEVMENNKMLGDYGLNCSTAKPQDPAQIGLAYRESETLEFESLEITPFSIPPELPEAMRVHLETQSHEQAMA